MAAVQVVHVNSALQTLKDIAETGGYMKKDTKESMLNAVSTIEEYLHSLGNEQNTENRQNSACNNEEVKGRKTQTEAWPEGNERCAKGQVAQSSVDPQNEVHGSQEDLTPSGGRGNDVKAGETKDENIKIITEKMDYIMDFLHNKLGKIMDEKIKNERGKNSVARRQGERQTGPTKEKTPRLASQQDGLERENGNQHAQHEGPHTAREDQHNKEEDAWSQVVGRKEKILQREKQLLCTTENNDEDIQAAQRNAWLFIGRLKEGTRAENIKKFLQKKGIQGEIECEELRSRGKNKAFKLGIPYDYLEEVQDPLFWPKEIIIRRFRFRKYSQEGISLEN